MTFMHRRMEDELARQLMLDEEFGMPPDATGKECVHRVEGLKAGQTFQFQVSVTMLRFFYFAMTGNIQAHDTYLWIGSCL